VHDPHFSYLLKKPEVPKCSIKFSKILGKEHKVASLDLPGPKPPSILGCADLANRHVAEADLQHLVIKE